MFLWPRLRKVEIHLKACWKVFTFTVWKPAHAGNLHRESGSMQLVGGQEIQFSFLSFPHHRHKGYRTFSQWVFGLFHGKTQHGKVIAKGHQDMTKEERSLISENQKKPVLFANVATTVMDERIIFKIKILSLLMPVSHNLRVIITY